MSLKDAGVDAMMSLCCSGEMYVGKEVMTVKGAIFRKSLRTR